MPKPKLNHVKTTLRLPPTDWQKVKIKASDDGLSVQSFLRSIIREAIKGVLLPTVDITEANIAAIFEPGEWEAWNALVEQVGEHDSLNAVVRNSLRKTMSQYRQHYLGK